jgi:hypothetical protein
LHCEPTLMYVSSTLYEAPASFKCWRILLLISGAYLWTHLHTGLAAASLRKFTLAYCTQSHFVAGSSETS